MPTAVATSLLFVESTHSIDFAAQERAGSHYLQQLSELQAQIGTHRVAILSSVVDQQSQLTKIRSRLHSALLSIDAANDDFRKSHQLEESWSATRQSVEELLLIDEPQPQKVADEVADESAKKQADALHTSTLNNLFKHTRLIGDNSGLVLDPDLDTFYLMNAVLLKLPPLLKALDKYRANFTQKTGFIYFQENRFTLHALTLQGQEATNTINIALNHNPTLADSLERPHNQFSTLFNNALESANYLVKNPNPAMHEEVSAELKTAAVSGYTLFDITNENLSTLFTARMDADRSSRNIMLCLILLVVFAGIIFTFITGRGITKTIEQANRFAAAIADDELDNDIRSTARDEPGQLLRALASMQDKLRKRITEERMQSISNGRIKQALESVSSVVLVADVHDQIIYCNHAGNEYFKQHESALAEDLAGFRLDTLLGQPIDLFYPAEKLLIKSRQDVSTTRQIDRIIGGRHIKIIASPVYDEDRCALGTVIELSDRTDKAAVEQAVSEDVHGLVQAALLGNLSQRINSENKPEFLIPVYTGINEMLSICNTVIDNAGQLFQRMANGDLSQGMYVDSTVELKGDFKQLQQDANATVSQLASIIAKVKGDAQVVSNSAKKVIEVNFRLEDNALNASHKANTVSNAVTSISDNVDTIASAAKQMSVSINEIARNTSRSTDVAEEAVALTRAADNTVGQLSISTEAIGAMIKVINSIAEQTNLLALNATIEAARAGEAGKGFAVVANEVKELAKETAKATEDISQKIRTIQLDSESAAQGIRAIDGIVEQINLLQGNTASAMSQQLSTTQNISHSINTVASGSSAISAEISELVDGTSETIEAVDVVKQEIMRLSGVAAELQTLVDNFNLNDEAIESTDSANPIEAAKPIEPVYKKVA